MIRILSTKTPKFTHIFHVADIHIRLNKRHDEYKEVFSELYKEIKQTPETTIIAVLGDVFHSKSDLSPECVQMASDFFVSLANIRPTVLIAGNHDCTLMNKNRLDSLTPIVDALNHPNFFYFKNTGLYGFGNILFNVMGVFDSVDKYIHGKDIPPIYRNQYEHVIALFHGPIDGASLETGFRISNPSVMVPLFDNHDMALLGDIHNKQDMQDYIPDECKPCIHYPGSLIQQTHGESLKNHGYSLWNLATRSYNFYEVPNNYGYFTIEINKGQLITNLDSLPKKVRLRVKCLETIAGEVKTVIASIKSKNEVIETTYIRMDQEKDKKSLTICKNIVLTDLQGVTYQGKLLAEYLKEKHKITDENKIKDILEINKKTNGLIKKDEFSRNLKWKPIRFEFDNMFSYGEGNVIDFTGMNGVYGIFGPNKSGKSSLLSAMTFCLFDKFDRGFKGLHVRNVEKSGFKCKFELEISGIRYFIQRTGETMRGGNVKVDVKFWRVKNDIEEELHGNARRDTNEVIRDYIGSYEDFILTVLSVQSSKNNISFVDMGHAERKDLLVQFIGLNIFDRLQESAAERNKELNTLLKIHKDKNYTFEKTEIEEALVRTKGLFDETKKTTDDLQKQIVDVNEQIVKETQNIIKLDDDIPVNLNALKDKKITTENSIKQKKQLIETNRNLLSIVDEKLDGINIKISEIEASDLVENHKNYKTVQIKINETNQKIQLKKMEAKGKWEKSERLKTHKYDPNCKFCVDNDFVRDATKAKEELEEDKKVIHSLMQALESLEEENKKYEWVEKIYDEYTKLLTNKSKLKDDQSILTTNLLTDAIALEKLETSLRETTKQLEVYYRNEISVQNNIKVNSIIGAFRVSLVRLDVEYQKNNRSLLDLSGKISQYEAKIKELTETLEKIKNLEYEFDSYQLYLSSVGRDGIPYEVIVNTVPEIEKEVNSILNQVVDFTVELETDGKNVIPYIVYEQRKWPIEMSSGFERFVTSLAIRVALTEISNLPKSTFLSIDEGFGVLDGDNMSGMTTLFSYLKTRFDFILIVSHIDALKDAVDKQIEIKRDGNFSKVIFA
jgi:DNA repair exonuclease SbcCD ATPase subunit